MNNLKKNLRDGFNNFLVKVISIVTYYKPFDVLIGNGCIKVIVKLKKNYLKHPLPPFFFF